MRELEAQKEEAMKQALEKAAKAANAQSEAMAKA
jgi:hypothetical protein